MQFVTLLLAIVSLTACQVGTPESKEKSTPEKMKLQGEYGFLGDTGDTYVLAKADRDGFRDQLFVIFIVVGTVPGAFVRAVDNNFMPLSGDHDCIDRFADQDQHYDVRSLEIKRGKKSLYLKFDKKKIDSMITEFRYTTKDTDEANVTYKYKKPWRLKPGRVEISGDHYRRLKHGDRCA